MLPGVSCRSVLRALLAAGGAGSPLPAVSRLLRSPVPAVVERGASLLGNLCSEPEARRALVEERGCAASLLEALRAHAADAAVLAAVLAAVVNALLEPSVIDLLVGLRQAEGAGILGPGQLDPMPCVTCRVIPVLTPLLSHADATVRGRASAAVARLARNPEALGPIRDTGVLDWALGALRAVEATNWAQTAPEADPAVRMLAVLAAADGPGVREWVATSGAAAELLRLCGLAAVPDATVGNAALCLSDLAKEADLLPASGRGSAVAHVRSAFRGIARLKSPSKPPSSGSVPP